MPDSTAENLHSTDESHSRDRELNLLYQLGETIGAAPDSALIPGMALTKSLEITGADLGAVLLLENEGWRVAAASGKAEDELDPLVAHVVATHPDRVRPAIITELPVTLPPYRSLLWAQLAVSEKILGGILLAHRSAEGGSTAAEMRLLAALATQAAAALNNARALERIRVYVRHLQELNEITREISSSLEVETVLERILKSACDLLGAVGGTLFLVEGEERELVFRVVKGSKTALLGRRLPAGTGIVGKVAETRQAQIVNRVEGNERWFQGIDATTGLRTRSLLAVPLVKGHESIGVLELINKRDEADYHQQDVALLEAFAGQAVVALENARLHQAELVQQRMEQELQLGFRMQSSLIPASVPAFEGWEFSAWWQPAREVSGDYYDFLPVGEQQGIVIADVADKGVEAALFMALTRSTIRASLSAHQEPAQSLQQANRLIAADAVGGMFVTLFYSQVDVDGRVTYVNAGHNPPLWYQAEADEFLELTPTGIFLGYEDEVPLHQRTLAAAPGDFLTLYTDGVTEARNAAGEMFGEERLVEVLRRHRKASAQGICDGILAALDGFTAGTAQADDVTLVIAKRL